MGALTNQKVDMVHRMIEKGAWRGMERDMEGQRGVQRGTKRWRHGGVQRGVENVDECRHIGVLGRHREVRST